jgi:hypothetical protein
MRVPIMPDTTAINRFLQHRLASTRSSEITAVEAAELLERAGLLRDSVLHPGPPLRKLLRAGKIAGAEQRPPGKYGRWFITRIG